MTEKQNTPQPKLESNSQQTPNKKSSSIARLGSLALAMLIISSIDNVRNLPAIAIFGTTLPFFFALAAILFLLPTALISAQLAILYPTQGGIYAWTKRAAGDKTACLAIWLQWINTLVWFPSILAFIIATVSYLIAPNLTHDRLLVSAICIGLFWFLTLINCFGLQLSTWFAGACTWMGMILPMGCLIILGAVWLGQHHPHHLHMTWSNALPHLNQLSGWVSLTGIMAGFLGIELTNVHARELPNPERLFPRALSIATFVIVVTMVFGALTIAFVIPSEQINLVAGIMQTCKQLLASQHAQVWLPWIGGLIVVGSIGKCVNWLIAPAKGMLQAAEDGFLPKKFAKRNQHEVPTRMLLLQAIIVSAITVSIMLMPSVNGFYWLLTDLSTELYLLMYLILFVVAWRLGLQHSSDKLKLVRGRWGWRITCLTGTVGTVLSLFIGFIPPHNIAVGGDMHYVVIFSLGVILMIAPVLLCFWHRKSHTTKS